MASVETSPTSILTTKDMSILAPYDVKATAPLQVDDVESLPEKNGIQTPQQPIYDKTKEKALIRKQDKRIVPLSAGIYLLCYLDRSNIGNAKVLNAATHDDLLTETNMTDYQYTIALMVFLVAYG